MREPKLSERTRWRMEENSLSRAVAAARARGPILDLTESNPTRARLSPGAEMLGELAHPRGITYDPIAVGHDDARRAIADYYRDRGATIDPQRVIVTASTSEAYGWLFKLLCDRDDAVLVPQPSYPLFEYLAALEDVRLVPYPLQREARFAIDLQAVERAIDARTRAILLVHPNNPTGTFVRGEEAEALEALAREHGLALIVDEVFGDYAHADGAWLPTFAGRGNALTFVLSGLSKVVAMPQVKLGWIVAGGPIDKALPRLEVIADTYLSVATPIQRALPTILGNRAPVQERIRARLIENVGRIDRLLSRYPSVRRLPCDGGWTAVLELPRTNEDWAETLARDVGVLVQPGWFYDFDREGIIVVSLLTEPDTLAAALDAALTRVTND